MPFDYETRSNRLPRRTRRSALVRAHARDASGPPQPFPVVPSAPVAESFILRRHGEVWAVGSGTVSALLPDRRGFSLLAALIGRPGREVHVLDLIASGGVADEDGVRRALRTGDAGELLDPQARQAYRARLDTLTDEEHEAIAFNDAGRLACIRSEIEALTFQLAAASGLGGRERRAGSAAERARVNVRNSIVAAIKAIEKHDPGFARHVRNAIKTGAFCAYEPDRPVRWEL